MKELLRVSVKQLKMAHECPRKWAAHYLFGVPQLEGPALYVGNQVHAQMEALGKGKPPPHGPETPYGKMARELFSNFAMRRSSKAQFEIEAMIDLPEYGISVHLRCDYLDLFPPDDPIALFQDWKTTGARTAKSKLKNGQLWALDDLTNDWQANVYAFLLMHKHWKVPSARARWCFVSKDFEPGKTPNTWAVPHIFHYAETKAWFDRMVPPVVELIRDMRAAHRRTLLTSLRDLPHNPPSCAHSALFCDAGGHCAMVSSPITTYEKLRLPLLPTKGQ